MKRSGFKKWVISVAMLSILGGGFYIINSTWGDTGHPQPLTQVNPLPDKAVIVNNEMEPVTHKADVISFSGASGEEVELPLQIAKADLAVDDAAVAVSSQIAAPTAVSYEIPPAMKDKLQAVLVYRSDMASGYLLLAPIGWEASAVVGANGSYGVTLTDPSNTEQTLRYSDTAGSCQGCAINQIGAYFPDQAKWADEKGFSVYEPLTFTEWNQLTGEEQDARTAAYTTGTKAGYYNTGIASYEKDTEGQSYLFRQLEFTLSEALANDDFQDIVLGFFEVHHGPLTVANVNKTFGD